MRVTSKLFYDQQYQGNDYAIGVEGRQETTALQAFVERFDLKERRVLEIGCGRGAFQDIVEKWIGVDLAFSAGKYVEKPFVAASASALPFKEDSFDAIWSITVLEHVTHPEKALGELTRVLRPGGVAYLAPAWNCRPWAANGWKFRPWSDLDWKGKLIKASIPLRNALWFRAGYVLPRRMWRETLHLATGRNPTPFRYRHLSPNYEVNWCSDCDACNSMDPHEMILWFQSRGWHTPSHPTWSSRFLVRHGAILAQKPEAVVAQHKEAAAAQEKRIFRLAVLASHPIQYQAPLYRALAARPEIDLTVYFCSHWGLKAYHDEGFGKAIKWDVPLLDGYHSELLPNWSPGSHVSRFWGLINPAVVQRLRKGGVDAVWVHGWARSTDWLAMLTAFASGIPVLLRGETTLLPTLPQWKAMLKQTVLKRLFRRVSGFLAIGGYNAEFYQAYGVPREKIFHVPYAVDNELFLSRAKELLPNKLQLKNKCGIPEDVSVVLFCGKLTHVKRPMDLLQAYAQVSEDVRCALVFVGDGLLRPELEAYAREQRLRHVYFMGFRNQTELPPFYAMADVLVLPSGFEPWGLVVNEAMCFGVPLIVSDQVGAGGDLVKEDVNGYTYRTGDVAILADRLRSLLSQTTIRQEMGEASRRIIDRWSLDDTVTGVLRCIQVVGNTKTLKASIS